MTRNATGRMLREHPVKKLWEARYFGADGRKHSTYAKTRGEAQERLRAALTAADNGIRPVSQRATVGAWLDEWLETSVRLRLRIPAKAFKDAPRPEPARQDDRLHGDRRG